MRMKNPAAIALLAFSAAACAPPPPVPPPRFRPNPPNPPEIVDDRRSGEDPGDQHPRPSPPDQPGQYPMARPTANPNEVISPFPPYNLIDVEGFRSGQLARDPSNKRIFVVP